MSSTGRYPCPRCGIVFANHHQLGGHLSVPVCLPAEGVLTPVQVAEGRTNDESGEEEQDESGEQEQDEEEPHATIYTPAIETATIYELLQRPTHLLHSHVVRPQAVNQPALVGARVYRLVEMQDCYDSYCRQIRDLYSDEFWRVFGSVYKQRTNVIDNVLSTTKTVFVREKVQHHI